MVGTPLIHSTPAGGAGAAFACSDLGLCSLANLGIRDHHLLTGLADDDHPHYALADKSRPSPWVAAADLAARSLADIGTRDHHLATGLSDDDHAQYALLAGRAGGQTAIGDTAASGHLTLQSTAHATRGYVRAQDDLQLLSNIIRDSGDTARITTAIALPHVTLTGNVRVSDTLGVGIAPLVNRGANVLITGANVSGIIAAAFDATTTHTGGSRNAMGLYGGAHGAATGTGTNNVFGLYFSATHESANTCNMLEAIHITLYSAVAGAGALTTARGIYIYAAQWSGSKPATVIGVDVDQQGGAGTGTAYGLRIADQTATTVRLLEFGPVTPYLRLLGGADPAANQSNLYLKLGSTLKQITEYDVDTAGGGYRALRVPN